MQIVAIFSVSEPVTSFFSWIFIHSLALQLYFYYRYFRKLARHKESKTSSETPAVSVLIAAKNESQNLKNYLPKVFGQDYPEFEVIVVNDHSLDNTLDTLRSFEDDKLNVASLEEDKSGKNAALIAAMKIAKHDHFLLTDADCEVVSENWISGMMAVFTEPTEIVLGHGRFFKQPTFLNKLIRFESLLVAIQYFSFAVKKRAYMGVGRNLAYKRSVAEQSDIFTKKSHIQSGDDDLLVNQMANRINTAVAMQPETHTVSEAPDNLKSYVFQKRRQLQAGEKYRLGHQIRLYVFAISNLLYYLTFLFLMLSGFHPFLIGTIFIVKQFIQFKVFKVLSAKLGDEDLLLWIPILEPLYMLLITLTGISTKIWKVNRWK